MTPSGGRAALAFSPAGAALWDLARKLREKYWDRTVFMRGIVEFSNHCRQNCLYCGLRRDNTGLARYRMSAGEVFASAAKVKALGFGTVVLQSGEDPGCDALAVAGLIRRIKDELGLAVTLSLGERQQAEYRLWRKAGADRYLLKVETLRPDLYAALRPGRRLEERLEAWGRLRDLGYEAGTGIIAGLPGEDEGDMDESTERLARDEPDMFSVSPFTPHPDTPLARQPRYGAEATLLRMARARTLMPRAHIPVTSALGLYGDGMRLAGLEVGDVLMPSLTPEKLREAYAIYSGKNVQNSAALERAADLRSLVSGAGFAVSAGAGGRWEALELKDEGCLRRPGG